MRPKELIAFLADFWGIPLETAWVLDRSLADNGLRTKGKGRNPPDMTRADAIRFLLAAMAAPVATKAACTVSDLIKYKYQPDIESTEEAIAYEDNFNSGKEINFTFKKPPASYTKHIKTKIHRDLQNDQVSLLEYLLILTEEIVSGNIDHQHVIIEIRTSHNVALVKYFVPGEADLQVDIFTDGSKNPFVFERVTITRTATVFGSVLAMIGSRTPAPMTLNTEDE